MEYPLDPKAELFSWGPIQYRQYYGDDPYDGLLMGFTSIYPGYYWPRGLSLIVERRMLWLHEAAALDAMGENLFRKEFSNPAKVHAAWDVWRSKRAELQAIESKIENTKLSDLDTADFLALWKEFKYAVFVYWQHATLPELSGYGAIPLLKREVAAYVHDDEIDSVMEVLTAPEELSFYQKEEIALANATDIKAHQAKYFWIGNSYARVGSASAEEFEKRRRELPAGLEANAIARISQVRAEKIRIIQKYGIAENVSVIAGLLCDSLVWQDERKEGIWRYLHTSDVLLDEAVRRLNLDKEQCLEYRIAEIIDLLEHGTALPDYAMRKRGFGFLLERAKLSTLDTETVERYWNVYTKRQIAEQSEIKGIVASKGTQPIRGTVRVVHDPQHAEHFNQGDILVTGMTSPDYVFLMKKAGAIVTDTGGLTSHAAIVSRELGVPCIIGTKVATSVLKDGDMVEVDAAKGIVRKL